MNRSLLLPLVTFAVSVSAWAQQIPVVEKTLPNGFKLLLVERHDAPSVSGGFVVKVGSANERPGITGIAHLFEHMMFKGTPTLGTKDAKRDLELINEQEQVRSGMRDADSWRTSRAPRARPTATKSWKASSRN
jgi:predicted Zn-dependent peptidase